VGVPVCDMAGTAIDGFDRGQVHAINVADDSCSLLHLPASDIIAESEDDPQGDGRADLAGQSAALGN